MSSPDPVPRARAHIDSVDCWCGPVEDWPGVLMHRHGQALYPDDGYVPDLKGVIEGDDAA